MRDLVTVLLECVVVILLAFFLYGLGSVVKAFVDAILLGE